MDVMYDYDMSALLNGTHARWQHKKSARIGKRKKHACITNRFIEELRDSAHQAGATVIGKTKEKKEMFPILRRFYFSFFSFSKEAEVVSIGTRRGPGIRFRKSKSFKCVRVDLTVRIGKGIRCCRTGTRGLRDGYSCTVGTRVWGYFKFFLLVEGCRNCRGLGFKEKLGFSSGPCHCLSRTKGLHISVIVGICPCHGGEEGRPGKCFSI